MGDGVEKRGLEFLALPGRLGAAGGFLGADALERDRHQVQERLERAVRNGNAFHRKAADGAATQHHCPRERGIAGEAGALQRHLFQFALDGGLVRVRKLFGAAAKHLGGGGIVERHGAAFKDFGDMLRHLAANRLSGIGHENEAAESVKLFGLPLARFGLLRLFFLSIGNVAGDKRSREEREQRNPVLRIGNREMTDGRQEEEVETQHGRDGGDNGFDKSPGGRDAQDSEQIRESGRGRVDGNNAGTDGCDRGHDSQAKRRAAGQNAFVDGQRSSLGILLGSAAQRRRPHYFLSPGMPPSVGANRTARTMDSDTTSAAATPRESIGAVASPSDRAITRSPSDIVLTGSMARAIPSEANCASFEASSLVSLALVATTTSVVFCREAPAPAPFFMMRALPANSMLSGDVRAPATIFRLAGSRTSPTALTAASAATFTPACEPSNSSENEPIPDFIACFIPRSLPTVAPVPAPTAPSTTGLSVAAAAADSPISRVGRIFVFPIPRSNKMAAGTIGIRARPNSNPTPLCSR